MSEKTIEIEEKSIDDAIKAACREFGVTRDKLNIDIISEGAGGFFGVGAKKAKIRASLFSFDFEEIAAVDTKITATDTKKENKIEPRRKTERKHESPARKEQSPAMKQAEIKTAAGQEQAMDSEAGEKRGQAMDAASPASRARELLGGILQRMSFECNITVKETAERIILNIEGDGNGLLIGKRGQNIDALQYIINKAVNKAEKDRKMIMVDSEAYRERRKESLLELAEKIREKVKKTKKPVSLSNMNAHDRRIIHMALQEDDSLITKSRGEGEYRKIIILPSRKGNTGRTGDEGRRHRPDDRRQKPEDKN